MATATNNKPTKEIAVKPKSTAGRKTLLTPEVEKEIIGAIANGVPVKDAMKAQGVSEHNFYNWIKRGSDEMSRLERNPDAKPNPSEVVFLEFLQSVERAKSVAVNKHVAVVSNAGKNGDWRASAWWLERRRPEEFGKDTMTYVAQQTNNLQINMTVTLAEIQKTIEDVIAMRKNDEQ